MVKRNFPNFIDGFLEYCSQHESPHLYKKWCAVSIIAGAIERKLWCSNGYVTTYPNMYIFIIGDRGVGKSVMTNIAVRLLEEVPGITLAANKINDASLIKKLVNVGKTRTFEYQSVSYKNASIFLYASEATSTFKEMYPGASIISTLTDLYNCNDEPWNTVAKWKKDTMKDDEQAVHNPCINLLACSTPQWLMSKVMSRDDIEGGFGSRVIMVVHEGNFEFKEGWQASSLQAMQIRNQLVEDLRHIAQLKGPMHVTDGWRKAHKEYNRRHHESLMSLEHTDKIMAACLARKTSTSLMKLSMVLSVAQDDKLELREEHCHEAWKMLTELEKHLPYAFKNMGESIEVAHTRDIWRYISQMGLAEVSFVDMCISFRGMYSSRKISEAFRELRIQRKVDINREASAPGDTVYTVINSNKQSPSTTSPSRTE